VLTRITFLDERQDIFGPHVAVLVAEQTTERRCFVRRQPVDNDLSDHAHQATRRDRACNCALSGNSPIRAPMLVVFLRGTNRVAAGTMECEA
jgi:hypothetical protein